MSLQYSRAFLSNALNLVNKETSLFRELGVNHKLCSCLSSENVTIPTLVQYKALPLTLSGQNCIIQSATGTGKSLTFLLPILQDMSPRLHSVIIVPSLELAMQLEYQSRKLISAGNQNIVSLCSGDNVIKRTLPSIIVGTPNRMLELINFDFKVLKSLKRVVLDEVDKLMPMGSKYRKGSHVHLKPTHQIMKKIADAGLQCQHIMTSASMNRNVFSQLHQSKNFHLIRPSNDTIPKSIENLVLTTSSNKIDILQKYLQVNFVKAIVVIHRNAPISQFVSELEQKGISATPLYKYARNLETYHALRQQHRSDVIVMTEETVRGIDLMWLDCVFLMNVPRSALEYMHICGRVGRMGQPGKAITIVDTSRELRRIQSIYHKLNIPLSYMDM